MDWSLALISQGIESTVEKSETEGWGLIVAEGEYDRAFSTIRQYRVENLRWPWRQKIRQQVLFDWGSVAWIFLLVLFFWLSANRPEFHNAGMMDSEAVSHGQWWRLFTAIFLHADLGHLAANASFGLLLLGLTMGGYGTGVGLLAAYLTGVGGNVTTWLVFKDHHSLGASGMVMGCLGLLGAQTISISRASRSTMKYILSGIVGGGMLFVLLGLNPESDVLAHLGGFIAGIIFGIVLRFVPRLAHNTPANLLAGLLFAILVILPWWLALVWGK
jgi:membrane associated rhomboid family serine protease